MKQNNGYDGLNSKKMAFAGNNYTHSFSTAKIGATGLEPVTKKSQGQSNKELTEKAKNATAQKLPNYSISCPLCTAENDTDLQQIITIWPNLPEHIKKEVMKILSKPYGK